MRKIINLLFILVISCFVVIAENNTPETQLNLDIITEGNIYGNFNLNSNNNYVWINGVPYPDYVDYKFEQSIQMDNSGMDVWDVVSQLRNSWQIILGNNLYPNDYEIEIAKVFYGIISYTLDYAYNNWILPIQIKQNAIIKTLDINTYCSYYAEEYFKVYKEKYKIICSENNMTYYKDRTDIGIKVMEVNKE